MLAISNFCRETLFSSPRHTISNALQQFSSREAKSSSSIDIFDEFIQIYKNAPENKKAFFTIQSNENKFEFIYKRKSYLNIAVDNEIKILIENIFFENKNFKFHADFHVYRKIYEKDIYLFSQLKSLIPRINRNLPKEYRIEKKELLLQILALKKCRKNQIPRLISKNESNLKHSFIAWKKDLENYILIKPMFKNKDEINSCYLAHGGFKIVKKTAILIQFSEEDSTQNISINPYVTVSQNVESDEIPTSKDHELKNNCGESFIASGFQELRFYDPIHCADRVLYFMPDMGFTIDLDFSTFHLHQQRDILLMLIDKCIHEKPNDVKISNTTLDQEGIPHFIDSYDALFTYTPFLHPDGDYQHAKESDFEHARILGLTYMFYQLINPKFMNNQKLSDILVFSDCKDGDIHTGIRNNTPFAYELKKAYFSRLTYSELRQAVVKYFNNQLPPTMI